MRASMDAHRWCQNRWVLRRHGAEASEVESGTNSHRIHIVSTEYQSNHRNIVHRHNPSVSNTCIVLVTATILAMISTLYPQKAKADEFTAADVLGWQRETQDWYFDLSIMMAGIVAAQNPGSKGRCINDWYFAPAADRASNNNSIRDAMKRFPTYHPGGVILAVIEKRCGPLKFTE